MAKKPAEQPVPTKLSDLTPWSRNPRQIDDESKAGLGESMTRFGDLSGIVFNVRNGALVGGHQRTEQLSGLLDDGEIRDLSDPDTIGDRYGWMMDKSGRRWPVRLVNWSDEEHAAANVVANSKHVAGDWDDDKLKPLLDELNQFDSAMFEAVRFDDLLADMAAEMDVAEDQPSVDVSAVGEESQEKPPRTSHHTVAFTEEQWEVVESAIKRVRVINGDEAISGSRAMELIAADFLAGATQESLT